MTVAELLVLGGADLSAYLGSIADSPRQIVAHLAAAAGIGMVLLGAFVRTMTPLRWLAVGSDLGLLLFGALHPSIITMVVAAMLLPINVYRAIEVTRLARRVNRAQIDADLAGLWLMPYMRTLRLRAGETLFTKGDKADRLYLLAQGQMELADIGEPLESGRIFGEIALFSPKRVRTHTVRCLTDCTVMQIHERTVKQLYFQNPAFGFHLIQLLAGRLSSDIDRAESQLLGLTNAPAA